MWPCGVESLTGVSYFEFVGGEILLSGLDIGILGLIPKRYSGAKVESNC